MKIKKRESDVEVIYEVVYDEEKIKQLIKDIACNCSVRKNMKNYVVARNHAEVLMIYQKQTDVNGNLIYENITDLQEERDDNEKTFRFNDDARRFSFKADTLIAPKLVDFLINLLSGFPIDYEWFTKREEINNEKKLEKDINQLNLRINEISNFDTKKKILLLKELLDKCNELEQLPGFDLELLNNYYDLVDNSTELKKVKQDEYSK